MTAALAILWFLALVGAFTLCSGLYALLERIGSEDDEPDAPPYDWASEA